MLTFKAFLNESGRDPRETLKHLETLASHPNTPKHEAEAARGAAARIRQAHNIPHHAPKHEPEHDEKFNDDHFNQTSPPKREPSKDPKGTVYRYRKNLKKNSVAGSIHKKSDTSYATYHRYAPTKYHKSWYAAHEHMKKHGFEPS